MRAKRKTTDQYAHEVATDIIANLDLLAGLDGMERILERKHCVANIAPFVSNAIGRALRAERRRRQ